MRFEEKELCSTFVEHRWDNRNLFYGAHFEHGPFVAKVEFP
jgi:hypothetical protein